MTAPAYKSSPPWAAGRLVAAEISFRRGLASLPRNEGPPERRALLLVNHFFDGEIASMSRNPEFVDEFHLVILPNRTFFRANWSYFPPAIWRGDAAYDDPTFAGPRLRSAAHARRLLRELANRYDIAAVASPSDAFFWVREFFREARAAGLRTFVFDKEGVISPATFDNQPGLIRERYPPIAEHFYVWNDRQTAYWARAGLPAERTRVLGSLRTDLFVSMPDARSKAVLFFDFDTGAYLEDLADPTGTSGGWGAFKAELHDVILAASARFPDVAFTIKCHPQQTDLEHTRERFKGTGSNVRVLTGSVDVHRIVEAHSIVIGFQTTALLETALTNRPALYCGWGALHDRVRHRLLPLMEPGFGQVICERAEDVLRRITVHLNGTEPSSSVDRRRLEEFFHQPDGTVSGRYLEALRADLS